MGRNLLYRLFGLGKLPRRLSPELEGEGIVLLDEGIGGSVTFRRFRAPGRRYSWRRNWFTGSIVITGRRFAAYAFSKPIIDVLLVDDRFRQLHCSVEDEAVLRVQFDSSVFHEGWSGSIECRFSTSHARLFWEQLEHYTA